MSIGRKTFCYRQTPMSFEVRVIDMRDVFTDFNVGVSHRSPTG